MKTAVAVFVKTPGIAPVKTRLAKTIGDSAAESFFMQCIQTIEKTLEEVKKISAGNIEPIWAVGEKEGTSNVLWKKFNTLYTGDGSLGERQHTIYSSLIQDYDSVILLGADSPQITPMQILEADKYLTVGNDFVMGPAMDGGYYLFGGNRTIPKEVWTNVRYSVENTGEKLIYALKHLGSIKRLKPLVDVDTFNDIGILVSELYASGGKPQMEFVQWLKNQSWAGSVKTDHDVAPTQFGHFQCG